MRKIAFTVVAMIFIFGVTFAVLRVGSPCLIKVLAGIACVMLTSLFTLGAWYIADDKEEF